MKPGQCTSCEYDYDSGTKCRLLRGLDPELHAWVRSDKSTPCPRWDERGERRRFDRRRVGQRRRTRPERWYHGTNEIAANSIMHEGLREGSYITPYLAGALEFGGPWVIAIALPDPPEHSPSRWQVALDERIGPERILWLKRYSVEPVSYSRKTNCAFFEQSLLYEYGEDALICPGCGGYGCRLLGADGPCDVTPDEEGCSQCEDQEACATCGGRGVVEDESYWKALRKPILLSDILALLTAMGERRYRWLYVFSETVEEGELNDKLHCEMSPDGYVRRYALKGEVVDEGREESNFPMSGDSPLKHMRLGLAVPAILVSDGTPVTHIWCQSYVRGSPGHPWRTYNDSAYLLWLKEALLHARWPEQEEG